ncbi:MAG: hypothetical protein ISS88_00145 [Candidatus Portnoybacteria bacterium]|nr:hypothetical protein [Candidatus Portnoybacteria bacterium]
MNLLNKKILLGIVIIVLLIIAGGVGAIFYWQKTHTSLDISPEAVKAKCLEDVGKMSDEELIKEVKNLKYTEEIDPSTGEERITLAQKRIINYLICRVKYNRNPNFYNKAKNFIEGLTIQEENKQSSLAILDRNFEPESSFAEMLALRPLESICLGNEEKDELLELCLKKAEDIKNEFSPEEAEEMISRCKNVCDFINKYINNISLFEADYLNNLTWPDNKILLKQRMLARVSISFHLGGKELALKLCNYVPNLEIKEECQKYANFLDYMKNCKKFNYGGTKDCGIYKECAEIRQGIINLICEFDL